MAACRSTPGGEAAILSSARRRIVLLLRVVAAFVFGYAGWIKFRSPQAFADSIATFQLLPAWSNNLLALGLPPFEIGLGVLLLSGWRTRTAAFCGLVASGVFLLALISAMIRRLPVECGCFGEAHSTLTPGLRLWLAIGRDMLLVGAVALVYFDARQKS